MMILATTSSHVQPQVAETNSSVSVSEANPYAPVMNEWNKSGSMDLLDDSFVDDVGDPEISECPIDLEGSSVDESNKLMKKANLKGSFVENLSKSKTKPDGSLVDKSDKSLTSVYKTKLNGPIRKVVSLASNSMSMSISNSLLEDDVSELEAEYCISSVNTDDSSPKIVITVKKRSSLYDPNVVIWDTAATVHIFRNPDFFSGS